MGSTPVSEPERVLGRLAVILFGVGGSSLLVGRGIGIGTGKGVGRITRLGIGKGVVPRTSAIVGRATGSLVTVLASDKVELESRIE